MTDSRDALYRAISANPDEDTPRLAYADLVEEEGNAAHAAFISPRSPSRRSRP